MRSAARPPAPTSSDSVPRPTRSSVLELEGPVLGMAEAEPEPRVGLGRGVDVRDAPAVAADAYGVSDAGDPQGSAKSWQSTAEQQQQRAMVRTVASGRRRHQARGSGCQRYTRPVSRTIELFAGLRAALVGIAILGGGAAPRRPVGASASATTCGPGGRCCSSADPVLPGAGLLRGAASAVAGRHGHPRRHPGRASAARCCTPA